MYYFSVCSTPLESPLVNFNSSEQNHPSNLFLGLEWPISFSNQSNQSDVDNQASEQSCSIDHHLNDRINETILIAGKYLFSELFIIRLTQSVGSTISFTCFFVIYR